MHNSWRFCAFDDRTYRILWLRWTEHSAADYNIGVIQRGSVVRKSLVLLNCNWDTFIRKERERSVGRASGPGSRVRSARTHGAGTSRDVGLGGLHVVNANRHCPFLRVHKAYHLEATAKG